MKSVRIMAFSGAAFLVLASAAEAGSSTAQERAETRALNLQYSQSAQQQANSNGTAKDASANLAANAPPMAAPTIRVQTADVDTVPDMVKVTPRVLQDSQPALAPMALNSLSNPPLELATARVVDDKGATIGAVQKVDIAGGKPSRVEIVLLGSQQIVALDAGTLSYDVSNNVLTAGLDKNQIVNLPHAPEAPQG